MVIKLKIEFDAVMLKHDLINGAYFKMPFDVEKEFGARRVKVVAMFDNYEYRGSIVYMGDCFMIGITQAIRKAIGKEIGDIVHISLVKDEQERVVEIPQDLEEVLKHNEEAKTFLDSLSFSIKKKMITYITDSKKPETRQAHLEKIVEMLSNKEKMK